MVIENALFTHWINPIENIKKLYTRIIPKTGERVQQMEMSQKLVPSFFPPEIQKVTITCMVQT